MYQGYSKSKTQHIRGKPWMFRSLSRDSQASTIWVHLLRNLLRGSWHYKVLFGWLRQIQIWWTVRYHQWTICIHFYTAKRQDSSECSLQRREHLSVHHQWQATFLHQGSRFYRHGSTSSKTYLHPQYWVCVGGVSCDDHKILAFESYERIHFK